MAEIARLAGVSKNTVSLALRHDRQIPGDTRDRIASIAASIGYTKNATVARLMAELRRGRSPRFQSSLALLNAHADRHAFRTHPTIPTYVQGCRHRAKELGYCFDEFWLHDPDLDGVRLNKILHARGIAGVIVVGLMRDNRLRRNSCRPGSASRPWLQVCAPGSQHCPLPAPTITCWRSARFEKPLPWDTKDQPSSSTR